MSVNTSLLVMAPVLQDYLVDKDNGLPLANGTITLFQDNSRTTLKNWYYLTGTAGAYTFTTLPNPMTLSGIGTIQDGNGNDVLPFYYPYSEVDGSVQPYYIVVQNSNGETQFTRQNFPFIPTSVEPTAGESTNKNLLVNNVFWRNIGSLNTGTDPLTKSVAINGVTYLYETLAPSQHDGYTMPDITYFKNNNSSIDVISFNEFVPPSSEVTFPNQVLENDVTPEFYMNIQCDSEGSGEINKYIQIPLCLHVRSLSGYAFATLKFHAMGVAGNPNATLGYSIFQFLGTGVNSPAIVPLQQIALIEDWTTYEFNIPIPSADSVLPLDGGVGDDALFIVFSLPTNAIFNINIAKPAVYLSENVPTDDFDTYDEVNAIISSPRTGDLRVSVNSFLPFGWVPMNDGTIGGPSSNANTRANNDTWQLFNLLWTLAKPYDTGSNNNPICQMFTSAGAATNFSSSAYGDFALNKALALTKIFGRVLLGTVPIDSLRVQQKTTFTASNVGGNLLITTTNNVTFFNGMPISFTTTGVLPGGIVANNIYYVSAFNGTNQFNVSTAFSNAISGVVIAFTTSGSGSRTVISGVVGSREGEYDHELLLDEMVDHTHDGPDGHPFVIRNNTLVYQGAANAGDESSVTGGITGYGGQNNFNVTQPGSFHNIFIKL